jgi:hypothetical protein
MAFFRENRMLALQTQYFAEFAVSVNPKMSNGRLET